MTKFSTIQHNTTIKKKIWKSGRTDTAEYITQRETLFTVFLSYPCTLLRPLNFTKYPLLTTPLTNRPPLQLGTLEYTANPIREDFFRADFFSLSRDRSIFMGIWDREICNGTAGFFDPPFERGHVLFWGLAQRDHGLFQCSFSTGPKILPIFQRDWWFSYRFWIPPTFRTMLPIFYDVWRHIYGPWLAIHL